MKLILSTWACLASFLGGPFSRVSGATQRSASIDFSQHGGNWYEDNCGSRERQSPIDLNELYKPPQDIFNFKYHDAPIGKNITVSNNGKVIAANFQDGSLSSLGGIALKFHGEEQWFNLASIEVKSRSEHTLRGKHYPLEIQLVHRPQHFFAHSEGPEAVTISIFVDCPNPPTANEVYPGLLQMAAKSSPRLRGNRSFSLLQQAPGAEASDDDEDPVHLGLNAEVNFVHSLVEGEDALASAGVAAGPSPAGASAAGYSPPPPGAPNFNALLQFLVAEEPPDLDSSVVAAISPDVPLKPAALVAYGTYFYYWGSQTLPPCASNDMWLIKREPMMASTQQVTALFDTLHLMSGGAGNFRTSMPLNGRVVEVLRSEEGIPSSLLPQTAPTEPNSQREAQYIEAAQDAITLAKAASDYGRDLENRVRKGAVAHLKALEEKATTTFAPTTSVFIPAPPEDKVWAANVLSNVVKDALKKAVEDNVKEMVPATASLTISYLRQRILENAGYQQPPPGARLAIPTPLPGVPTFEPPETVVPEKKNASQIMAELLAANCTSMNATCIGIPGLSPLEAQRYVAKFCAANVPGFTCDSDDENQMTPDDVRANLPPGVDPVPANWPDPDGGPWKSGLPPSGIPPSYTSEWPDPNGAKPAGWDDYKWQQYKWNWQVYNSQYEPYKSSYQGYSISRRRRQYTREHSSYDSAYSSYNSGYSAYGARRRSYSSNSNSYDRSGSSYSSNYGNYGRSGSSYSSPRRRSYTSNYGNYGSSRSRYSSSRSRSSSSRSRYSSSSRSRYSSSSRSRRRSYR